MIAEIIGPNGRIHYRRPENDPLVTEARNTPGYSVRMVCGCGAECRDLGKLGGCRYLDQQEGKGSRELARTSAEMNTAARAGCQIKDKQKSPVTIRRSEKSRG